MLEVNETQIKYKRCDNLEGPLIVVNKNDVYSIKYTNGNTDNFIKSTSAEPRYNNSGNSSTNRNNINPYNGEKKVHPLAWVTLACTIGIIFASIFAIIAVLIIAPIAKQKIKAQPDRYKGLDIILGCQIAVEISLLIGLLLLLLIFAFL